jgi:hypothetical protein
MDCQELLCLGCLDQRRLRAEDAVGGGRLPDEVDRHFLLRQPIDQIDVDEHDLAGVLELLDDVGKVEDAAVKQKDGLAGRMQHRLQTMAILDAGDRRMAAETIEKLVAHGVAVGPVEDSDASGLPGQAKMGPPCITPAWRRRRPAKSASTRDRDRSSPGRPFLRTDVAASVVPCRDGLGEFAEGGDILRGAIHPSLERLPGRCRNDHKILMNEFDLRRFDCFAAEEVAEVGAELLGGSFEKLALLCRDADANR